MELNVLNTSGAETGKKISLSDSVFNLEPNDHAIYLDVKQFLANQRQGTHKSKERSEISATTKKLKRQKGTGGARAGDMKSPVFVGGGRVFGPRPRTYGFKLNQKTKILARKSALSYKAKENNIVVVENFSFDGPKTKNYLDLLSKLNVAGEKTLLVIPGYDKNIQLSGRNLTKSRVMTAADLNTYEILNANKLIVVENALEVIVNTLK